MPHSNRDSLANLAEHYRRRGDHEKSRYYAERLREEEAADGDSGSFQASMAAAECAARLYGEERFDEIPERCAHERSPAMLAPLCGALLRLGRFDEAVSFLSALPETPDVLLRRRSAQLLPAIAEAAAKATGRVHVLLLAHNREEYVRRALEQLAATGYGDYAVYMADNGSTDGTWEAMRAGVKCFPVDVPVSMERLPTNIGRPAGHNWLLSRFSHAEADYIAIADDDLVEIAPSWLSDMIGTMSLFPRAAAVGGLALNPGLPRVVHGGIRRVTAFGPDRLEITNECEEADRGQFAVVDLVDHVIGCLHLYRREALEAVGPFDLRFSPCQLVDIEHHLRARVHGYDIVFNGFIEFRHLRGMGRAAGTDRAGAGNSLGNVVKLLYKFDQGAVRSFLKAEEARYADWLHGGER